MKTPKLKTRYYGIKNNKVVTLYPHKKLKKRSTGRHKSYILWKTTRKNLPGKTFHGKFYKTRSQAQKNIKHIKNKTRKNK